MVPCELLPGEASTPPTIHMNHRVCSSSPVACPNRCGLPGDLHHDIAYHLEEECRFRTVFCDYRHAGCEVAIKFNDIPEHNSEFHQEHFDLVSEKLLLVMKENDGLSQRNRKLDRHLDNLLKMIRNLDRTEYEIYVRVVTSKDAKKSPPAMSDVAALSSSPSSSIEVKGGSVRNGGLSKSESCEAPSEGHPGEEQHYMSLRDMGRGSSGDSVHYDVLVKPRETRNTDPALLTSPAEFDSSDCYQPISSDCYQPLSEKPLEEAIYEDIDSFDYSESLEKRSPANVDEPADRYTKGRTKSEGYQSLLPTTRLRTSPISRKSRLHTVSQLTGQERFKACRSKGTMVDDTENGNPERNGDSVGQNGVDASLEPNVYDTPIPKRNGSDRLKRRRHKNLENTSDLLGEFSEHVPLPQDYAQPVQTCFQKHSGSETRPSPRNMKSAKGNSDRPIPSRGELKSKPKLTPSGEVMPSDNIEPPPREEAKPRPARKIPLLPVSSKGGKVSPHDPAQFGSKVDSRNGESTETNSVPAPVEASHDPRNVLTPPPRKPISYEKPLSGVDSKPPPPRLGLKPKKISSKFFGSSKIAEKSNSEASTIHSFSSTKLRVSSEPNLSTSDSKSTSMRARTGSKSLKIEPKLATPHSATDSGSKYTAAPGSKSDLTPRSGIPVPGSKKDKVHTQKPVKKHSGRDIAVFEQMKSELLSHF